MKSLLKGVLSIGLGVMLCFTSCSNGSDDPTFIIPNVNNSTVINNSVAGIKFDFSGAKALAAVNSTATTQSVINSTSTIQAAESETSSPLIKILEDGSSADAVSLTGNGNLSTIKKIYKSPLSTSSDVFVIFDNQSWINNNGKSYTLGTFVCVHADGTVADILKKAETSNGGVNYYWLYRSDNSNLIKFDGLGNAYFMISDNNNETAICKFNPNDNTTTKLTAGVSGINYNKFMVTSDGQLIIVDGSRWNGVGHTRFLRAIPISDPDHFTNIYYITANGNFINWNYDDQNGICYFSDYEQGSLSRCIRNGTKFSDAENIGSALNFLNPIDMRGSNNVTSYVWKSEFLQTDGTVNAKSVLDYMFKRCWISGEKEFKLTYFENLSNSNCSVLSSSLTNEDAIKWIDSDQSRMQWFCHYLGNYWNTNIGCAEALKNIIFKKGTNESAYRSISDDETKISHYWRENDFYFSNSEGLWMNYSYNGNGNNAFYVVHVVDSKGYPVWEASKKDLPSGKMTTSQVINNTIYMSYSLLTSSGAETGYHQIYSVNLDTGAYKNLFQNVPNNSMLEVISYSVGSDLLYYSAVRGTTVENGVVNVTSGEYNPLTIKKKLTAIYTF